MTTPESSDAKRPQLRPGQTAVKEYYAALESYRGHEVSHELAVKTAFQRLLEVTARKHGWHLVPEQSISVRGAQIRPDGLLRDDFNLHRGYWEAKDTSDKLGDEIKNKVKRGYPLANTIFEDTRTAVLFQNGKQVEPTFDLADPNSLCDLLNQFYSHAEPDIEGFEQAVVDFKERVPELALGLKGKIDDAHKKNKEFQSAFEKFFDLCRASLNPNLSDAAVDEMLIQHLLTERLIRTVFDREDFVRRNVIAAEVEKVIDALTSRSFSRQEFLKSLDRFYVAIESAAAVLEDFSEKQHFLNTVYERFFQGYSVKTADTHGIVYTPQEIVDFMCTSVVEVLEKEFGKTLGSKDVNILDPCTGTGNFIVNLIRRVPKRDLERVYANQLFANEVMLLPYYIAALNIEHSFYERIGTYESFEGLCFVDTLDLAEERYGKEVQKSLHGLSEENTQRVERQKLAPITVVIGNPPYNMAQQSENDNNKNRSYPIVEKRVKGTFIKASKATNVNKLSDPYVKFFRWAIDRLAGQDGIVCLVSNNGFVDQVAFDGMRKHLCEEFSTVYHLDLHGNVRRNPKLSGTTHNVFGIQVGVGITCCVRNRAKAGSDLFYYQVPEDWNRGQKLSYLASISGIAGQKWRKVRDTRGTSWRASANGFGYSKLLPIGTKGTKASADDADAVFKSYSIGVVSNRDHVVYDTNEKQLWGRVRSFIDAYNVEVFRYQRAGGKDDVDSFVDYTKIKWSRDLKKDLKRGRSVEASTKCIRPALYRPFSKKWLYFDPILNQDITRWPYFFPTMQSTNQLIIVGGYGRKPFSVFTASAIADLNFFADPAQCFPYYVHDKDGTNCRENITDWALKHFRDHYGNKRITKWDIFYYVYGVLHHPGYREKFDDNLKRELPRIPLAPDFKAFAAAGKKLAELHLNYESLEPWPLEWIEVEGTPLDYRVEKMKLSKDKTQVVVNESLTLAGIPAETFEYRLGNRSALDWVIDQYRVRTDKQSGITSDPNNLDDEEYIVKLVGQVVRVSVETVKIVKGLPAEYAALG